MDPFPQNPEILYRIFEFAPDAIILVDNTGRIVLANQQAERMFGYSREALVNELVEKLIPQRFAERHVQRRDRYINAPHTRPMGVGQELFGRRQSGEEFPVDIMLSPIESETDALVLAVVRDATERKRAEEQTLRAREMYFKEVHHRVKNNLQVISSLLFLRTTYTTDPDIIAILTESQSRVKSIALIHEKLYRSPQLVRLDFDDYVRDLVADLFRTYASDSGNVSVSTRIENVSLEADTAIPCGLIINELISNALKHAFRDGRRGHITIEITQTAPKQYLLAFRDNGVGFPADFDIKTSSSLGLKLVDDLTRQLDGQLTVKNDDGAVFQIQFHELHYRERG